VAEWEVEPQTEEVSALDTLVDLAVGQPRRDTAQSASQLLGPINCRSGDGVANAAVSAATTPTTPLATGDSWPSW